MQRGLKGTSADLSDVDQRTERPRSEEVVTTPEQNSRALGLITAEGFDQRGLADSRLATNEYQLAGAVDFRELLSDDRKRAGSFQEHGEAMVPMTLMGRSEAAGERQKLGPGASIMDAPGPNFAGVQRLVLKA